MYFKFCVFVIVVLNLIVTIKCKSSSSSVSSASSEEGKLIFAHIVSRNIAEIFNCFN